MHDVLPPVGADADAESRAVHGIVSTAPEESGLPSSTKAVLRNFLRSLEQKGIRYCHWKSNMRLGETLSGAEDVDLLVDRRDAALFHSALIENGFKLARSRSGAEHPGVFHAVALDDDGNELVHLHAYHQIVTGDSLVKNYRLPVEDVLLGQTRYVLGVRVPTPEAEIVLFALRIALKHVAVIEILMVNRGYRKVSSELAWLRAAADIERATELCTRLFPRVEPALFRELLDAIADDHAPARRIVLGWRIAHRLRNYRRLHPALAAASRVSRVSSLLLGRFCRRRGMALQGGGAIVALVGPKATGKSTLARALEARLGRHLHVRRIHSGKPPATAMTILPRLLIPLARKVFANERPEEYHAPERRREKRYSLLYVLRMTILAYDRRTLLRKAARTAIAGGIVVSDRYPSASVGIIDGCCFDEAAVEGCGAGLKRWLMQRERSLYRGLPKPDLVIRLAAPMTIAIQRDAQRVKAGGPNADAVQRRWELERSADFSGVPVIDIDSTRPLEEVIRAAVSDVWNELG